MNKNVVTIIIDRPNPGEAILHIFELPSTENTIKYMHAAAGFPVKETWIRAVEKYELKVKEEDGQLYVKIRKGMYGLPQAGILAQNFLEKRLKKKGYYQSMYTPGLWFA